jgi:hypothetical protein
MARDPAQRYQTAADMRAALLAAPLADDPERPTAAPPIAPPRAAPAPAPAPAPARRAATVRRAAPPARRRRQPRRWVIPTLVIVLVGLCLALAGVLFARTNAGEDLLDDIDAFISGENSGTTTDTTTPAADGEEVPLVPIASVSAFDPEGDGGLGDENADTAANVADGNPGTTWRTESYNARSLPPLKAGVGIYLTLEEQAELASLDVISTSNDWAASVFVASGPGETLADWGDPVAEGSGLGTQVSFDLGGIEGGAVLLWITDLGDGPPRVFTEISEMSVVRS